MTGIKLPIDGDIAAITKKIELLGEKIDKLGRKKVTPVDPEDTQRDIDKVEQTYNASQDRMQARNKSRRQTEDGPRESYQTRRRYVIRPEVQDVPNAAFSGFGGGFSQIVHTGTRGALAGASEGGGMAGGVAGLLRGTAIGALAYGAYKAGSAVSEGMAMAREHDSTVDLLKRQMGDVGVSFDRLRLASENVSTGLAINAKDFAAIEKEMNAASRGADKTPLALADSTSVAAGFARSYGVDPGQMAGLFGSARNVDKRQDYRQFAMILAETIEKTGMASRATEVTQAVLSFASAASRIALSSPNIGAFAGAYSGMVNSGITGMTPEVAAGILGQANGAVAQLGAAGEPGQAFMFAALQRSGKGLNPLEAATMASGGLFGTRASVFGQDSAVAAFMGPDYAKRMASGGDSGMTTFDMVARQLRAVNGNSETGKLFQAESAQRLFGLQSIDQAMALLALKPGQMGAIGDLAKSTGTDPSKINFSNVQTLAQISGAKGTDGLQAIYEDLKTRTGTSALTKEDIANIEKNRGSVEGFRGALFTAANSKDYAQDIATTAAQTKTIMENVQTILGHDLIDKVTSFQNDMVTLLGGHKKLDEMKGADADYVMAQQKASLQAEFGAAREAIFKRERDTGHFTDRPPEDTAALKSLNQQYDEAVKAINAQHAIAVNPGAASAATSGGTAKVSFDINLHDKASGKTTTFSGQVPLTPPRASGATTNAAAH